MNFTTNLININQLPYNGQFYNISVYLNNNSQKSKITNSTFYKQPFAIFTIMRTTKIAAV